MMPAADATAIVYSHLLDSTGLPRAAAHAMFEADLDEPRQTPNETADRELTADEKRAVLRRRMVATGEDITGRLAGAAR